MAKNRRFLIGALIILAALSYVIYGGMQQALVYFVTPSELKAKETSSADKFFRMGGMVVKGSLQKDVKNLTYKFELTDGSSTFPVFFRGVPPDLFREGTGAVVEGRAPIHSGESAMATLQVCLAMVESSRQGKEIGL